ncbi:Glycosyltransferase MshA involved in mycothiol biosynthesis [Labilithrix luteola]|uniref:Glycosyltransferase MshA involved in mycothiol biosynthesis n=1 Tax=Labilithrix luteola TaxID=1391654 RepID=A0A0K1PRF0_9BACT|nr:glycosyltransferase family 4 protein [Labilithrix luteola]AKU96097.1 Glycosyltransferase MshA involved in mycothiol biosynthesis [Labilithrix luteola]
MGGREVARRGEMHIAWVVYGSLEQKTGGTLYDARIVRGLEESGDVVHVHSLDPAARAPNAGIKLATEILRDRPDVVVGDELCFRELAVTFPVLARAGQEPPIPRVLLVHHLTAWEAELSRNARLRARAAERFTLRFSDAIVTTSEATRHRLRGEVKNRTIDVVVPGADRFVHASMCRSSSRAAVRFVFVGAIVPRKRVLTLVHAFATASKRCATPTELVLVGSTTREPIYAGTIERTIAELGLGDRIRLLGERPDEDVAVAIADADVLVLPSSLEGWGIAATEAIHAGTPVIAARTAGLVEALSSAEGATLFADGDRELEDCLARFATDAELRGSMAECARRASAELPRWSESVVQFRRALLAACGS